jgi:hypothetical protein
MTYPLHAIIDTDRAFKSLMDTPANIIMLSDYCTHSDSIIGQYKSIIEKPVKVSFSGEGVHIITDNTQNTHVHDESLLEKYILCVRQYVPVHLYKLLSQSTYALLNSIPLVSNDCMVCGSTTTLHDGFCKDCNHKVDTIEFNNSYADLHRVNAIYKTPSNHHYRQDICCRTIEEIEGKCTTCIPIHIHLNIIKMLLKRNDITTEYVRNIHLHMDDFVNVSKHDIFQIVSRIPDGSKYRLNYQVNHIFCFLRNIECKNFQKYKPRLLTDLETFDNRFMQLYKGKHALNIHYFIYAKFKEYGVLCSIDDFYPMSFTPKKYQYMEMYNYVIANSNFTITRSDESSI